ncbi:MAG: hypothetical protein AAGB48_10880 [Planctomycetota bacterium]
MSVLSQIKDGREAWAEFFAGVTGVFESNESSWPLVVAVVAVVLVMWLNVCFARWLVRRFWPDRSGVSPRGGRRRYRRTRSAG